MVRRAQGQDTICNCVQGAATALPTALQLNCSSNCLFDWIRSPPPRSVRMPQARPAAASSAPATGDISEALVCRRVIACAPRNIKSVWPLKRSNGRCIGIAPSTHSKHYMTYHTTCHCCLLPAVPCASSPPLTTWARCSYPLVLTALHP